MTKEDIEHKAYLFFREKRLEYVDNIDELLEYCRDFAYPLVLYFEEKIADLKANFDYILEGKENEYREERKKLCDDFENMKSGLERQIATLGKRCNQLLKDKGNLVDELQELKETLAQTIENDEVNYETLKLHDQEEIGMLNSKIAGLEQQIEQMKCWCNCKNYLSCLEECCRKNISFRIGICYNCKKWEIKEND